jgi:hypothetical protein
VPSAIDPVVAAELREAGVPVLEGTRSGLLALRHLLDHTGRVGRSKPGASSPPPSAGLPARARPILAGRPATDEARRARGAALLAAGQAAGAPLLALLRDYGIAVARAEPAADIGAVLAAAGAIGYPVVLKTDEPEIPHKSDAGGVILGIRDAASLSDAYQDLAGRLGPRALVCESVGPGTELAIGIALDPDLGPLVVVGAGGVLVELLADRAVALPPVGPMAALRMLGRLRAGALLAGLRGQPPANLTAVAAAIVAVSAIASELGNELEALDVNPLICGPSGAIAVDALAIRRQSGPGRPPGRPCST